MSEQIIQQDFVDIFDGILGSMDKEYAELLKTVVENKGLPKFNVNSPEEMYFMMQYPMENVIDAMVKSMVSSAQEVIFIYTHFQYIEHHFRHYVEKIEGSVCCADKTHYLIRKLLQFYKEGTKIVHNYDQEYTYQIPTIIFATHEEIVEFFEAISSLYYGNPKLYSEWIQKHIL